MYPILYNSDGIYFHNGKGKLVDCISCVVSEELNGDYSLEFTYPITGPLFNELLEGGSVSVICPHMRLLSGAFVHMRAAEWFDIYKHSTPINGVVTFYANHVSRRLARLVYAGGKIGTGTGSVDGVLNRSQPSVSTGYDGLRFFVAPYSPPAVRDTDVPVQSVLATYIGAENSFVSNFGGDFIWTSASLYNTQNTPPLTTNGYYVSHRGEDRGAEIRYGFNMTDVENVEDSIDTYNAVVPYWEDSDGNRVFATGFLVQSDPPQTPIRAVPLNCSAWYDTAPTSDQLIATAENHLANHTPWNVVETLTVDFINGVEIDPHGAEIALGDTVHIYWKDGKIDATLRVVSYKYDVLAERYSELKLGTQQTHFVAVTGSESYSGATGGGSGGGLPSGGTVGQVLTKNSSADGDAIWADIVETGTDGMWTYRKWSDGTAECWGSITRTTAFTAWASPVYYGTTYALNEAYPTGLFVDTPTVIAAVSASNAADIWLGVDSTRPGDATQSPSYYALRINPGNNTTFTVSIHAIGRWKT